MKDQSTDWFRKFLAQRHMIFPNLSAYERVGLSAVLGSHL